MVIVIKEIAQSEGFPDTIVKTKELRNVIRTHGILPELRGKFWQVNPLRLVEFIASC